MLERDRELQDRIVLSVDEFDLIMRENYDEGIWGKFKKLRCFYLCVECAGVYFADYGVFIAIILGEVDDIVCSIPIE